MFSDALSNKFSRLQLDSKPSRCSSNCASLPTEILLNIFSYVSTSDLLLNVATASKTFYEMTKDTSVHVSVTLLDCIEQQSALRFFEKNNSIQEVNILPGKTHPQDIQLGNHLLKSLRSQKCLRVINFESKMYVDEDQLIYLLMQPSAKFLRKIQIMRFWVETLDPKPNFDWISQYPYPYEDFDWICHAINLSHLKLSYPSRVTYNTIMKIGKVSKKLKFLQIRGNFSAHPEMKVTTILQANQKSLKELQLNDYMCNEEEANLLIHFDQLESLSISLHCPNISKQRFYMITQNKHLKSLHLWLFFDSCKHINALDLVNLLYQPNLCAITSLVLSYTEKNNYNNEILTAVASLKNLKELYFNSSLRQCQKGNTYQGLFLVLHGCTQLEKIILQHKIQFQKDQFVKIFTMNLPNLKVVGLHHYDQNFNVDPIFVMECLYKSKSMNILQLGTNLYYKQGEKTVNLLAINGCENFHKHFPGAMADVKKAFDFKIYFDQRTEYVLKKIFIYKNLF